MNDKRPAPMVSNEELLWWDLQHKVGQVERYQDLLRQALEALERSKVSYEDAHFVFGVKAAIRAALPPEAA